jgi:hypothetical protein
VRALTPEECRNRPPDARAAAGDDGNLSIKIKQEAQAWKYYTLQLKSTISVYFIGKVVP